MRHCGSGSGRLEVVEKIDAIGIGNGDFQLLRKAWVGTVSSGLLLVEGLTACGVRKCIDQEDADEGEEGLDIYLLHYKVNSLHARTPLKHHKLLSISLNPSGEHDPQIGRPNTRAAMAMARDQGISQSSERESKSKSSSKSRPNCKSQTVREDELRANCNRVAPKCFPMLSMLSMQCKDEPRPEPGEYRKWRR